MPEFMENMFETIGRLVGRKPITTIAVALVVTLILISGYPRLKNEGRAEKQWVPRGALALDHQDYTQATWPSRSRFNFWIAECTDGEDCNAMDAKHIKELMRLHKAIMDIEVDVNDVKKLSTWEDVTEEQWATFNGTWSFGLKRDASGNEITKRKCQAFGPFCGMSSPLEIFRSDEAVIKDLTDAESLQAFNFWESQEQSCPVTIARSTSPCYSDACQQYKTLTQRKVCRDSANAYCNITCPDVTNENTCKDNGCVTLLGFERLAQMNMASGRNGSAPDGAFAFEPFKIRTVASSGSDGPVKKDGKYVSAKAFFGFYALAATPVLVDGSDRDPIAAEWESKALCVLGISAPVPREVTAPECPGSDLFTFKAQFSRSLSDEFGQAIRGDIAALSISYFAIIIYMGIMLSRRDHVHSMVFMSIITVIIVLLSFAASMGAGAYLGLMNNNLNGQIPFLLLGLGVDDAFVLSSEYVRISKSNPLMAIEERIAFATRNGGMSILITSVTDALAFFFGSITVLPALSWFCVFAGIGVVVCFLLQIFFFMPFLVLNERRAKANRYDLSCFPLCCFKATKKLDRICCAKTEIERSPNVEVVDAKTPSPDSVGNDGSNDEDAYTHDFNQPRGCCFCCKCPSGGLEEGMERFGRLITTPIGKGVTLAIFSGILVAGIVGCTLIIQDFKLEWFVPDDSYLNTFFKMNDKYFASGTPVSIYGQDIDYFAQQDKLIAMKSYLNNSKLVDQSKDISDWYGTFMTASNNNVANRDAWLTADYSKFKNKDTFYKELHNWYDGGGGARYRSSLQWNDKDCNKGDLYLKVDGTCDPTKGVMAMKMGMTLTLAATDKGNIRYETMTYLRKNVTEILGDKAFPYSFQFLYWEETGVIGKELVSNLISCGAVIIIMIMAMIPHPRIAPFVIFGIVYSVVVLVGFMHWWDITVSGVSTIYILISVGLAVDYSAHIAHMFVASNGTSSERSIRALKRIGPSVFNAICSTLLAVMVLGFSKSYIFRVFFKALFLTILFGGSVGLWLLPVLLSIFGGDKEGKGEDNAGGHDSPRNSTVKPAKTGDVELTKVNKEENKEAGEAEELEKKTTV